jgi:hypothetical protein
MVLWCQANIFPIKKFSETTKMYKSLDSCLQHLCFLWICEFRADMRVNLKCEWPYNEETIAISFEKPQILLNPDWSCGNGYLTI